jgi:hypothetical protein
MAGMVLFTFGIQEFICHRTVPEGYKYSSCKNRGPSHGPQNTKWFSKKTVLMILLISVTYGGHFPKYNHPGGTVRKITASTMGDQK